MSGRKPRFTRLSVGICLVVGFVFAGVYAAGALSSDFVDEPVLTGLSNPTNVEFAPDGRIFVAEKGGRVKVFDSLADPTPDLFADLSSNVHDFWDRGLLGLAIHPDFPATPYVYVLYTFDAEIGGSPPTWGDGCPNPPGATDDGCVVSGRLSRLTASGNQMSGGETVLIEDWCQQYPSHSIGDLEFGADGALYASAGDGASFNWVDYGQGGGDPGSTVPVNPCDDPPGGIGGDQTPPNAEGGALRSLDLRAGSDPVTLDGTIIRIDPETGLALPSNPLADHDDVNAQRIVADGLRNPFRMAIKPNTNEVFAGDVGWSTYEEVNHHPSPTQEVLNFGWPCYEGGSGSSSKQGGYDGANLSLCETLYNSGSVTPALFAYRHNQDITGSDACRPANPPQGTSSSISGLTFYEGGGYPGTYNGALFGSDYSRDCIWVMYADGNGNLDPSTVEVFQHQALNPVDLETGANGDIFYVNLNGGEVRRFRFVGSNTPPIASFTASPSSGTAPLNVILDGSASSDPDSDPLVSYEWDLDNDGQYDDATGPVVSALFGTPGSPKAHLRVTDSRGETGTATLALQVSNSPPVPTIDTPSPSDLWTVGDTVTFSGHADDADQGALPDSALEWNVILHHCEDDGSCHTHPIQTFSGTASGSFSAPDHEYPSWIELELEATDQYGSSTTTSIDLDPVTVELTFDSSPSGLDLSFVSEVAPGPFTETVIVNSLFNVGALSPQFSEGRSWSFEAWSDGGGRFHEVTAPGNDTFFLADFNGKPIITSTSPSSTSEGSTTALDVDTSDDTDTEGGGLIYSLSGGVDSALVSIDASSGLVSFMTQPDFEQPADSGQDNSYEFNVSVTDSGGLNDFASFVVNIEDQDEIPSADTEQYVVDEDASLSVPAAQGVLNGDTDPEGEDLKAGVVLDVGHGSLQLGDDGSFTYLPAADFFGADSFRYEACDPGSQCAEADVTITVNPVNDPPIAASDEATGLEDSALIIDVTSNDEDIDDGLDEASVLVTTPSSHGDTVANPNGTLSFTPQPDWNGQTSVQYTVADNSGTSSGPATVDIDIAAVNDPPGFSLGSDVTRPNDAGFVSISNWATEISPGTVNEFDQALTFTLTPDRPSLFSLAPAIDPNTGDLTFTPRNGAYGTTSIEVLLEDNGGTDGGGSDTSQPDTFNIEILPTDPIGSSWHQNTAGVRGTVESGDAFGTATAAGDFDGDGADDLAIGASGEDLAGVRDAGMVHVLSGGVEGLHADDDLLIYRGSGVTGAVSSEDRLGSTLAAGDFDNDGFDDLVVGVMNQDIGTATDAGAVHVLHGSATGLNGGVEIHQDTPRVPGLAEPGDMFGSALATGDLNDDGFDDLLVSAIGEAIGPIQEAGSVTVFYGSASGLQASGSESFHQGQAEMFGNAESGDHFGSSLAIGDVDGDGYNDAVIGSADEDYYSTVDAGVVYLIAGSDEGLDVDRTTVFHQDTPGIPGLVETGDRFGSSVAVSGGSPATVFVGVPHEDVGAKTNAGAFLAITFDESLIVKESQDYTQGSPHVDGAVEHGDLFGRGLLIGQFGEGGSEMLLIAAPGEAIGSRVGAGMFHMIPLSAGSLQLSGELSFIQSSMPQSASPETGDGFGMSLGSGDFNADGQDSAVVGTPNEAIGSKSGAGMIHTVELH